MYRAASEGLMVGNTRFGNGISPSVIFVIISLIFDSNSFNLAAAGFSST